MVTVKGRATWDVIDIILDVNKYQDKCNMMGLSLAATLPSVHYTNPGFYKTKIRTYRWRRNFCQRNGRCKSRFRCRIYRFIKYNRT
ncbi:MAG: hypothetical protein U0T78_09630 [Cloacibacterium normanense]